MDGHERADVVASRSQYLKDLPPPPCSDEKAATPPPDAETRKTIVSIFHDESISSVQMRARLGCGPLKASRLSSRKPEVQESWLVILLMNTVVI